MVGRSWSLPVVDPGHSTKLHEKTKERRKRRESTKWLTSLIGRSIFTFMVSDGNIYIPLLLYINGGNKKISINLIDNVYYKPQKCIGNGKCSTTEKQSEGARTPSSFFP